tara:strand:- start:708 stop:1823 length:1116 start_codon:yes stop_codon:yes gene_type:complete
MTFFNKKEEVIEIELTTYGKSLYSRGVLKPSYYAFFDSDVIYDAAYGSTTGNVDQRISDTPRSKVQTNYISAEKNENREVFVGQRGVRLDSFEASFGASPISYELVEEASRRDTVLPIGSSTNENSYYPAWRSYMLLGETTSSVPYFYYGETGSVVNIPQIDVKQRTFTAKAIRGSDDNSSVYGYIFPDGSSVTLKEDSKSEFLLYLEEKNSTSNDKNFDIEVYEVRSDSGEEILYPLKFEKKGELNRIVDGIMLDNDPGSDIDFDVTAENNMVEYYFDMELDKEIDRKILQKAFANGRFTDIKDLESLMGMFSFATPPDTSSGGPSTSLYGLSLDDISRMNSEILEDLEDTTGGNTGDTYLEEEITDEPC